MAMVFLGRVGARYTIHSLPHRGQWTWNTLSPRGTSSPGTNPALAIPACTSSSKLRGRFLLDNEALACLIVLLFVDEPQLNTARLHRVLRNLCHYAPTRMWVVKVIIVFYFHNRNLTIKTCSSNFLSLWSWLAIVSVRDNYDKYFFSLVNHLLFLSSSNFTSYSIFCWWEELLCYLTYPLNGVSWLYVSRNWCFHCY